MNERVKKAYLDKMSKMSDLQLDSYTRNLYSRFNNSMTKSKAMLKSGDPYNHKSRFSQVAESVDIEELYNLAKETLNARKNNSTPPPRKKAVLIPEGYMQYKIGEENEKK